MPLGGEVTASLSDHYTQFQLYADFTVNPFLSLLNSSSR